MARQLDVPSHPVLLDTMDALLDPAALKAVLGVVDSVRRTPLTTNGYSGSTHERWEVLRRDAEKQYLVLKRTRPAQDWTAFRTGDAKGREALLLATPALARVWEVFSCPYRAYAAQDGEIAILMDDLSDRLFPDVDEPISLPQEDSVLAALANLHAAYWESDVMKTRWLVSPPALFGLLGPASVEDDQPAFALTQMVREGWTAAFARLPSRIGDFLRRPAATLAECCRGLPRTLLHGDAKVANFAVLSDGRVSAFDWALVGAGPPTLDLGWYLAVNSGRLARPREDVIAHYRDFLEARLGTRLSEVVWRRMMDAGLLCGALMLLWSKASALESGSAQAAAEWQWWVDRLERQVRSPHRA